MKKMKSCSTLRVKAHQLLNEEEREVFKYAIRNYRKNQSIDTLCEIISKIITDSNRSCLISLIADMLKEEQKSQFLHRCYSRLPGYNLSQNHLESTEFQVNNDFKSNNLSLRVATFVSKNRMNQSRSNYRLGKSSISFDESVSTVKFNETKNQNQKAMDSKSKQLFSESEELLKTIERCSRKERPALASLQDKGFWVLNNDSVTDNDSMSSYSSIQDKEPINDKTVQEATETVMAKYNYGLRTSKTTTFNGDKHMKDSDCFDLKSTNDDNSKLMVCKLHFSSVNILQETQDMLENLSVSSQSTVVSLMHLNSFDDIFIEYHIPPYNGLSPLISSNPANLCPRPLVHNPVIHRSIMAHKDNGTHHYNGIMTDSIEEERDLGDEDNECDESAVDRECQTSIVQTRDISTQTFLA